MAVTVRNADLFYIQFVYGIVYGQSVNVGSGIERIIEP